MATYIVFTISEQGRDISEKIALGLAKPTLSKESMYDARLFNQSEGIGSGFRDDDGKVIQFDIHTCSLTNFMFSLSIQHL